MCRDRAYIPTKREHMERWNLDDKEYYSASYNMMAGTSGLPVIRYNSSEKHYACTNGVWGIIPPSIPSLEEAKKIATKWVNARAETVNESRLYGPLLASGQRCLIPCTVYYEHHWLDTEGKVKVPFAVRKKDEAIFSIPGLYAVWQEPVSKKFILSYTMLTTPANPVMQIVHNGGHHPGRMPLAIDRAMEEIWLDPKATRNHLQMVLNYTIPSPLIDAWPVHPIRGKNKRTGAAVLDLNEPYAGLIKQSA